MNTVNPKATNEAKALLKALYTYQNRYCLTGQHNYIGEASLFTDQIIAQSGQTPLIWGSDFGFSEGDDKDSIAFRDELYKQCVKRHKENQIVVISYHQGNPAIGEPCPFVGGVQSPFSEEQWEEMLTEGTALYKKWTAMMDLLADFLKRLEKEDIPVIFRPYHEMNGDWFWWGARPDAFKKLWIQTYRYYTEYHDIRNLIWAWCSDKPWEGLEEYYPGHDYVDVLGCDIYPQEGKDEVYPQEFFDRINNLAEGRIVALTENSVIPDAALWKKQPWSWFMGWSELTCKEQTTEELKELYAIENYITLEKRSVIE